MLRKCIVGSLRGYSTLFPRTATFQRSIFYPRKPRGFGNERSQSAADPFAQRYTCSSGLPWINVGKHGKEEEIYRAGQVAPASSTNLANGRQCTSMNILNRRW